MLIAIDAGTGFMKLAYIDVAGRPSSIEFPDGENQMASCVYFENSTTPVYGSEAKNQGMIDPQNLVEHWKRSMGTNDVLFATAAGKKYLAKDILVLLLLECKRVAETALGTVIIKGVITTPANYNDPSKEDTLWAAKEAGLDCIKLVHEPTAALISKTAGASHQIADGHRIVVDVGCGTTDVSLEEKNGDTHAILQTNGVEKLGGLDFTERLVSHCISELKSKHGISLTQSTHPEDYSDLWNRCEAAKKTLNRSEKASIPMIVESKRLQVVITRAEFAQLTQDLTDSIVATAEKTLSDAGIGKKDVLEVIPIGGGSQLMNVLDVLTEWFEKPISNLTDPYNAVAKGAVLIGWQEEGTVTTPEGVKLPAPHRIIRDVTAHAIGIVALDDDCQERFSTILNKGVPMPSETTKEFALNEEGQIAAVIEVIQGKEGDDVKSCTPLGDFELDGLPPIYGKPHKIEIRLRIDKNGLLTATAHDANCGKTTDLHIQYDKSLAS